MQVHVRLTDFIYSVEHTRICFVNIPRAYCLNQPCMEDEQYIYAHMMQLESGAYPARRQSVCIRTCHAYIAIAICVLAAAVLAIAIY